MFSYLEVFLSGRHLPHRLSGSFPFRFPFAPSLSQLESGLYSRLHKHCTNNREYLHLLQNMQDSAISSVKSKEIKAQEWMADMELTCSTQKQRQIHMGAKSIADIKPEIIF